MIQAPKGTTPIFPTSILPRANTGTKPLGKTAAAFDTVMISTQDSSQENQFRQDMESRLLRDVRTRPNSSELNRIKESVQNGTYQVNVSELANRLLLEGFPHAK